MWNKLILVAVAAGALQACGGSGQNPTLDVNNPAPPPAAAQNPPVQGGIDAELRALIGAQGLTGDPTTGRNLPDISDPLAQLGKKLFFTKALGGEFDSACVTCHHPAMGGGDSLSLSFGVGALAPDLLGPGRGDVAGIPNVPRNAPTTFNIGIWDSELFLDGRVSSLGGEPGQNGAASGISTPDSGMNVIDLKAGANLVSAQARFPVTSVEEMRGTLEIGQSNEVLRSHLAARLGNYGAGVGELNNADWLTEFQAAFASAGNAETLITFDNIVMAIAAYERSQVFVDNPWREYVLGDNNAISMQAKQGAVLFLTEANNGGGGCVDCHSGDLFTDEEHHAIGTPQFGPGKGNPNANDFGRENITNDAVDRFRFRTPSLLNIAVTAPYMHTGAYETLQDVLRHYDNPGNAVDDFFDDGGWCRLEQFETVNNCPDLYPNARQNSNETLSKIQVERNQNDPAALPNINLNNNERNNIVAFLRTLTDPCVASRVCMAPWIPAANEAADEHQLNAVDINGDAL